MAGYLGNAPTAVPLTSADITDSTITNADIANSTINLTQKVTGALPVANGGTGLTALGTASQLLRVNSGATALEFATVSGTTFGSALFHVRDEKASGTSGGSATSGSYQTRTLNTVKTNEISGASLSSNQITLPSGTYFVNGFVASFYVDKHKSKLRNITDSTDTLIGQVIRSDSAYYSGGPSIIIGRFTISAQKTFEIQTRVQTTRASDGYGEATSFGEAEVYIDVQIWKVA